MASSNVCWGVEVGAGAIKALKLQRDGDDLRVLDFVVIPHKRVLSTPDIDQGDAIRVGLGALMGQYRDDFKGASVAVSVPGHASFARFAKLPPVQPKDVAGVVKYEADQQIPFPMEDVEWDYQTFQSEDSPDVEVGIFAITKQRIHENLAQQGNAGLTPSLITLGPLAAYNAIAYDLGFTAATPGTILLDIGTTSTDLIVAEAGRVWIRTFPIGGHNFTEAIAETFKLPYAKAERLKRDAESSKYRKHIFQAIKPILADLVGDVQRSIQYYEDTHPDANLQRLVGMGSTFRLPGLRKLLTAQIKLDVYRLERFKRLQVEGAAASDFEAVTLNMATCYGLALQALGMHTIGANLMPVAVLRKEVWRHKTPWFIAAACVGLLAGGVTFVKPAMEASEISRAKNDKSLTRPISDAKSLGSRLKNEWQEASGQSPMPGFVAWNMRELHTDRQLYESILARIDDMLKDADEQYASTTGETGRAFMIRSVQTGYIKPGDPLKMPQEKRLTAAAAPSGAPSGSAPPAAASGRDSRGRGGKSGGGGLGGGGGRSGGFGGGFPSTNTGGNPPQKKDEEAVAGDFGAIGLVLVLDSDHPDNISFVNDSILTWLRDHTHPVDTPFTIENPPRADDIAYTPLEPSATDRTDEHARPTTTATTDSGGGGGGGGGLGGRGALGGSQSSSASTQSRALLTSLPPLPDGLVVHVSQDNMYRYTIQLILQITDPNAEPGDTDSEQEANATIAQEDQA